MRLITIKYFNRLSALLLTGYYNDQLSGKNQSADALIQTHY
jgi:hypothetical protein